MIRNIINSNSSIIYFFFHHIYLYIYDPIKRACSYRLLANVHNEMKLEKVCIVAKNNSQD